MAQPCDGRCKLVRLETAGETHDVSQHATRGGRRALTREVIRRRDLFLAGETFICHAYGADTGQRESCGLQDLG